MSMTDDGKQLERPKIVSLDDFLAEPDGKGNWGLWRLDPTEPVIYPISPYRYEIDLETCTSCANVLDWIAQIAGKGWNDDDNARDIIGGLVVALDDILDLQSNLCGFGVAHRLTKASITKRVSQTRKAGWSA
jgi:hypothetical protein